MYECVRCVLCQDIPGIVVIFDDILLPVLDIVDNNECMVLHG